MSITSEAAARVAEYIRQRDIAMSGGNVGDVITTVYADTDAAPVDLDVNDLRVLVTATHAPGDWPTPLGDELRAAAARVAGYVGDLPQHWGVAVLPLHGPVLVQETDDEDQVETVGTLDGFNDSEMDLIGLMSPQTGASLSALLDQLAAYLDELPPGALVKAALLDGASALAQALNRQQEWSTHPGGIRMQEPTDG